MVLVMKFQARLDTPTPAGWNEYLAIEINGTLLNQKVIVSDYTSGYYRLINRVEPLKTTLGQINWWKEIGEFPCLLTFFSNGKELDKRIINYKEEGFWYLLDISDVANFVEIGADERIEKSEKNTITFINTYLNNYAPGKSINMIIENLEIGYLPRAEVGKYAKQELEKYGDVKAKEQVKRDIYDVTIGETGEIEILIGVAKYKFTSSYSCAGEKIGFNSFNAKNGENRWSVSINKVADSTFEVLGEGSEYTVKKTIEILDDKIKVKENIKNKKDEPIGVIINHETMLTDLPQRWWLAGVDNIELLEGIAENPTFFITSDSTGLGFVAEDNLLRAQGELVKRNNVIQYSTRHFGLDQNKDYTFEFSLYPSLSTEYFSFINKVRNDWNVNHTILGPFAFSEEVIPERQIKIYAVGPWFDYYTINPATGKTYTWEEYENNVKPIIEKIKSQQADAILLGKVETNLYSLNKKDIEGGEILPGGSADRSGKYGLTLNSEQSEVLKKSIPEWLDSILQTEEGNVIVDNYYLSTPDSINLLLYLKEGNYRFKHFIKQIDFLMDKVGFGGVYIDQFTLTWGKLGRPDRQTYEQWDGFTVDIDETTGKITRKYTDCGFIGATARGEVLKHITYKGGIAVVNTFPTAKEEQNLPNVFRFAEFESDPVNPLTFMDKKPPNTIQCAKGHLSTPIILGIRPVRFGEEGKTKCAEIIIKSVITALRNGSLYYYYESVIPKETNGKYGPVNHMFPFTPVEINEGYLIGKERVITCVSKTFHWEKEPKIYLFDLKGREIPHNSKVTENSGVWEVNINLNDWNEIAVIE
ncbi:MAG TPA: hypothetical protein PLX23_10545 [Candidatus Hydrogenedens sp.]|nr:hypothetical protein [Candidatus Hydrogenedens sp.]